MKNSFSFLSITLATVLVGTVQARAAVDIAVPVTAAGLSTSTSTDWVTDGLATLNGATSGLDPTVSLLEGGGGSDTTYAGGYGQSDFGSATVEWPSAGTFSAFGTVEPHGDPVATDPLILDVGSTLESDVAANGSDLLVISEVTSAAGDYTLNGVTQTATAFGQVLEWTTPVADLVYDSTGATVSQFTFTSDALPYNTGVDAGPVGFSAESVPEPSTWAMLLGGFATLIGLQVFRFRRA
jgi:hypothetical protein